MALCSMALVLAPVIFLLSLSFFVLVVLANVKTHTLKVFGYVIVALIWLTTVLVFAGGVYKTAKGGMFPGMYPRPHSSMHMKTEMMKCAAMGMLEKGDSSEVIICPKAEKK